MREDLIPCDECGAWVDEPGICRACEDEVIATARQLARRLPPHASLADIRRLAVGAKSPLHVRAVELLIRHAGGY